MNEYLHIIAGCSSAAADPLTDEAMHAASAGEIFGHLSQRAADVADAGIVPAVVQHMGEGFSATALFHAVTLLLLLCYVTVLHRNPDLLKSLRDYIFSPGSMRDQHLSDNRNDPLRQFSWGRLLLSLLFVCTATLRLTDMAAPAAAAAAPMSVRLLAVPFVAGLFFVMVTCQNALLALTGTITVSRPLTSALGRVRSIYFRLATVILTPVLLLWALAPAESSRPFEVTIVLGVLFVALAFLRETFLLFVSKKLSIYHWILYLCTVEAFPVSLVCLLAVRG